MEYNTLLMSGAGAALVKQEKARPTGTGTDTEPGGTEPAGKRRDASLV